MFSNAVGLRRLFNRAASPVLLVAALGCSSGSVAPSPQKSAEQAANSAPRPAARERDRAEESALPEKAADVDGPVAGLLERFAVNRDSFRTLHVVESRTETFTRDYYLAKARNIERNLELPGHSEAEKATSLAQAEEYRKRATSPILSRFVQDFRTDRDQFQSRTPRGAVDPQTWKSPDDPVRPETLSTAYKDVTIYSFNPSWERPLRVWPGTSPAGRSSYGMIYSKKVRGQWDFEAREAFWFPALAVTTREWGAQKWHPIDEFFAGLGGRFGGFSSDTGGRYRLLKDEKIGDVSTAVVQQVLLRNTGVKPEQGGEMQQRWVWKAWIDRNRGCLPTRMELRTGLALDGRVLYEGSLEEVVEVTDIRAVEGAGFYPAAGEVRTYDTDPNWDGRWLTFEELFAGKEQSMPKAVLATTTTWNVIELEANRPLDEETFALRFPDDIGIFDDGQIVERLEPSPAVQPGEQAPEWRVAGWTDGKSRKLSDFRGHVVVLDFWGIWCGPCRRALPVVDRLQEKYREKGVVVLSIHNAGSKAPEPQRTIEALKIGIPVGIDAGKFIETSETVARYGVRGFPTHIIIDRNGTVRFNSGIVGDESAAAERWESAARALEIPWPIDAGLPADVPSTRFNDLLERLISDEVELALKTAETP